MTLEELREHVMFQTNNDVDDLDEFQPSVDRYLNEGYDRLVEAYADTHLDIGETYVTLSDDDDIPAIPEWAHRAIGDYGAYMVYRNGNQYKQARGDRYLQMFNDVLIKLRWAKDTTPHAGDNGYNNGRNHFYNLYT